MSSHQDKQPPPQLQQPVFSTGETVICIDPEDPMCARIGRVTALVDEHFAVVAWDDSGGFTRTQIATFKLERVTE